MRCETVWKTDRVVCSCRGNSLDCPSPIRAELVANIDTYLDQVVDVFYVTDLRGAKIQDDRQLAFIRQRLMDEVDSFTLHGCPAAAQATP